MTFAGHSGGEGANLNQKTFGTAGKERRPLGGGDEAELFQHRGHGCLTHMWFGGDFPDYGRTRIRIYVDSETTPSIDAELSLMAGIGFQDDAAPWGTARMGKTGSPSGIYHTHRVPFGRCVRVTAQRAEGHNDDPPFWWIIRGVQELPVTVGGLRLPDEARLHLYRREELTVAPLEELELCSTTRGGVLYQVTLAARSGSFSYLESTVRAYLDGSHEALLLSSGLEDYFLGTCCFNRGRYYTPIAGVTHLEERNHSFSAYRFHEEDPIFFHRGLRLACRCGEEQDGRVFGDPQPTTYTSYAWTYEWGGPR
jgi:hypothetical protein